MKGLLFKSFLISAILFFAPLGNCVDNLDHTFKYESANRRDPFCALVTKEGRLLPGAVVYSESEDVKLEGIIWDPVGRSVAIINGKLIQEGQDLGGLKILKIEKTKVLIEKNGKNIVVNLNKKEGGKGDED